MRLVMARRYRPDDIIRLALANPGYGFERFMDELHGSKPRRPNRQAQLIRLFEIHEHETGVNPFGVLQDTSRTRLVSRDEWNRITNNAPLPSGFGYGTTRVSKLDRKNKIGTYNRRIPLPPQDFDWLDVTEVDEDEYHSGKGTTNHIELMDYDLLLRLHDKEMMTLEQISKDMTVSERRIERFLSDLAEYDDHGVSDRWLAVMKRLWRVQCHWGHTHKEDELMMDFRGIFRDYIMDPVNVEAPTIDDVDWVYQQLVSEQTDCEVEPFDNVHCNECTPEKPCGNSHVYVIQFMPEIGSRYHKKSDKGYLYVGSTGKGVMQRFEDNYTRQDGTVVSVEEARTAEEDGGWKYNTRNSKNIRRFYLKHRPELFYSEINPILRNKRDPGAAERWERRLADKLRNRGWRVAGPTNRSGDF